MTLGFKYLLNYFTFLLPLHDVLAIRSCDLRSSLLELKSQGKFINEEKSTTNRLLYQQSDPTLINVSLTINDLNIIDVRNLDIEIDLEMTQKWYDDRLGPDYQTQNLAVQGAIWQPKITFVVGNTCSKKFDSDQTQFWRGTSNGRIFYSERYLIKAKCTKNFARYPFDVQRCFIKIGSYRFTAEEVILSWDLDAAGPAGIKMQVKTEPEEFRINKFDSREEIDVRSAGNFSVLVFEINLERKSYREVIENVLPSFVLINIAYTVFWIKLSAIRERIFTCQFSFLGTLILFVNSNNYHTVNGSAIDYNLKALDLWFFVSFILILIPLIESILITNYLNRNENLRLNCTEIEIDSECRMIISGKKLAVYIEKTLRILHPFASLCCLILFFTIFDDDYTKN